SSFSGGGDPPGPAALPSDIITHRGCPQPIVGSAPPKQADALAGDPPLAIQTQSIRGGRYNRSAEKQNPILRGCETRGRSIASTSDSPSRARCDRPRRRYIWRRG